MARPPAWDWAEILNELLQYIDTTDIPIVAEFAHNAGVLRQQLYEMPELSDALKACVQKKEMALEQKALAGQVNCSMAIFSLKQLGWKDTHTQEHTGARGGPMVISNTDAEL